MSLRPGVIAAPRANTQKQASGLRRTLCPCSVACAGTSYSHADDCATPCGSCTASTSSLSRFVGNHIPSAATRACCNAFSCGTALKISTCVQIDGPEADSIPADVHRLGGRIIGGLRSVHMVCSTALANGLDTSAVRDVVNAAARDRGKLFGDKHREELEGWLLANKVFRSVYEGPPLAASGQVSHGSCLPAMMLTEMCVNMVQRGRYWYHFPTRTWLLDLEGACEPASSWSYSINIGQLLAAQGTEGGNRTAKTTVNGFARHAGTADYASDGEKAGKRVKVAERAPTPPPPPPPPAAPQSPPLTSAKSGPASALDGSEQNGYPPRQPPFSDYLPAPPGLSESLPSSAALPVYDPFAGTSDPAEAMDIDGPPGTGYGPRSTSLSHYVPLEPLPPPPAASPGSLASTAMPPAPVAAIAANPGFGGAGRRSTAEPEAGKGNAAPALNGVEAAPMQPTELVPADVDTLLRCAPP